MRFVGMSVLYKKVLQDFGGLPASDRVQLVDFLRQVVRQAAAESDGLVGSMAARAYAAVGILQVMGGEEPQIIEEIFSGISSTNSNDSLLLLLLELTNSLAEEMQSMIMERANYKKISSLLKSHKLRVITMWIESLKSRNNSPRVLDKILDGITSWVAVNVNFLANPDLVIVLCSFCGTHQDYFQSVNDLFIQMIEKVSVASYFGSKTSEEISITLAKALAHDNSTPLGNAADILAGNDQEEVLTLHSALRILQFYLDNLYPALKQQRTHKRSMPAKCFAEMWVILFKSFPVFIFLEARVLEGIFSAVFWLMNHPDNSLSGYSFEIWLNLHRLLVKHKSLLTQKDQDLCLSLFNKVASNHQPGIYDFVRPMCFA